jgi:hypothetical protein
MVRLIDVEVLRYGRKNPRWGMPNGHPPAPNHPAVPTTSRPGYVRV